MCRVLAQEEIQRFSDLFDTPGEIPQPEEFIKSESDCTALYSAAVKMPDFKRYRMSMVYGEAADGGEEKEEGDVPEDGDIPDGETEPGSLDKWTEFLKIIKRGLQVSVGIFATAAAALILFWLVKKAGRTGEDDR